MAYKSIELTVAAPAPHMVGDGFRVHNFIPSTYRLDMQRMDPFIMMDYNSKFYFPPSNTPPGVGVHPHRGFETVTIAYKGKVAHHDSAGNSGVIGEGEVQWMTAASGVLHKEYHEKEFSAQGGDFQMVQLWVNLPAKYKMSAPKYQGITRDQIKAVQLPDNGGRIEVIAGQYLDVKGPAETFTPIHLQNAYVNQGAKAEFKFPANYTTAILLIEGKVKINEIEVLEQNHLVLFNNDNEDILIEALENSTCLVLSGQPIQEPIAAHGPFVMNTREEIVQAFRDMQNGLFGELAD